MGIATFLGITAIRNIGSSNADQTLLLLCETGEKDLDSYFESIEQSVEMVSAFVESDLEGASIEQLDEHVERTKDIFAKMARQTHGVLTYYYRIDPAVSQSAKGFWFVNLDGNGFTEHEATDISLYDTDDTSQLVWFTVPKATGEPTWLPPYITDNLDVRVLSYNIPVYKNDQFIGVVGIEIDYSVMAQQVDNISLYDNGYAFINDADGTIIYHPRIDVATMDAQPKVPDGLLSDSTLIVYEFEGVEKQAAWLPLSNGMRLNVTVPVSEINATWQKWVNQIFVVSIALLRFAGHITKPLRELAEAAEQVNAGNYDCQLDYDGHDEIGILTSAFNRLTANVKTRISNLNDLAYADALTSVRNKGAFDAYVDDLQGQLLEPGEAPEFAICIFDCNHLKTINDRYGHDKGDIYLKTACSLICHVFDHSAVFRIGGDEFAAVLLHDDFQNRDALVAQFDERSAATFDEADASWLRVDVARGIATFDPQVDATAYDVVRRADKLMYQDKRKRKSSASAV